MSQTLETLKADLEARFGPLMGGSDLWRALGFRTATAFGRAQRKGSLNLHIFDIHKRRGKFALTRDVADWLERAASTGSPVGEDGTAMDPSGQMAGQPGVSRQSR